MFRNEQKCLEWDDLRVVLVVAKAGTLGKAAEALGTSHPTVFRRIREIERNVGASLFTRSRRGYLPTELASPLIELAERIDADIRKLELRPGRSDEAPRGRVTLTTAATILHSLLPPIIAELRTALPGIELSLTSGNQLTDLNRREADIALRSGGKPPEDLVGRALCDMAVCLYRPRGWRTVTLGALDAHPWVVPDANFAHQASMGWLAQQGLLEKAVVRCDSIVHVAELADAGVGMCVLPCYLGDTRTGLCRVGEPVPEFSSPLWLLWHPQLRGVPRIKAVLDFLSAAVHSRRDLIEGRRPATA